MDGVFNTFDKFDRITTFKAPRMKSPYIVDLNRINAFSHVLLQVPFIQVVVSSTWRLPSPDHGEPMANVKDFARVTKLPTRIFHRDWRTPLIGEGHNRAAEVNAWLEEHPEVFKYVVIDDNYADQFCNSKQCRYIKTDPRTGITQKQLDRALDFFSVRIKKDYSLATSGGPLIL